MRLKNKKTGKVLAVESISSVVPTLIADKKTIQLTGTDTETGYREMYRYKSLAELAEEWEDAPEEPKEYWYMTAWGDVYEYSQSQFAIKQKQAIGNYFESEEEAEKAVEKLKAWKRLKDKGFKFQGWDFNIADDWSCNGKIKYRAGDFTKAEIKPDLDLLFGGEE